VVGAAENLSKRLVQDQVPAALMAQPMTIVVSRRTDRPRVHDRRLINPEADADLKLGVTAALSSV
jgi:hypothetical protein